MNYSCHFLPHRNKKISVVNEHIIMIYLDVIKISITLTYKYCFIIGTLLF